MEGASFPRVESELLEPLVAFLRERSREDDAALFEPRLDALRQAAASPAAHSA
jgi:hypothetical protein